MTASLPKTIVAAVIVGVIILASVVWYSLTGPAPRTSNVTPADSDYPIVNPHPRHTTEVTLLMPASLNLQLSALYSAALGRDVHTTPVACHFVARSGSQAKLPESLTEYSVETPVPVFLQGAVDHPRTVGEESYRALVAVDKFAVGRCHWTLDRVLYRVKGAATSSQLFDFDEEHRSYAMAGSGGLLTFWCKSIAGQDGINASELCIGHRADPPDDTRFIGKGIWPVHLGSEDTEVQIEFRDRDHPVAPEMVFP
jgi:hypothetical protein